MFFKIKNYPLKCCFGAPIIMSHVMHIILRLIPNNIVKYVK